MLRSTARRPAGLGRREMRLRLPVPRTLRRNFFRLGVFTGSKNPRKARLSLRGVILVGTIRSPEIKIPGSGESSKYSCCGPTALKWTSVHRPGIAVRRCTVALL